MGLVSRLRTSSRQQVPIVVNESGLWEVMNLIKEVIEMTRRGAD
jgi:hypothetical protein